MSDIASGSKDKQREGTRAARTKMADNADDNSNGSKNTFDGTGDYRAWKRGAQVAALKKDTPLAGAKEVFNQLRGTALDIALEGIDTDQLTEFPFQHPSDIFRALQLVYDTDGSENQKDARRQLMRLRQGNKDLSDFLPDFLALASRGKVDNITKIAALQAAVNQRLAPAAAVSESDDFGALVAVLKRYEMMTPKAPQGQRSGYKKEKHHTKGRQAITRDRSEIVCFNCNKKGHFKRDCRSAAVKKAKADAEGEESGDDILESLNE
jgi:Zinc knuckle